jgi:hypothetical protein
MFKMKDNGDWNFEDELNLEKEIGEGIFQVYIVVNKIQEEE